jgi:hypothetical protein
MWMCTGDLRSVQERVIERVRVGGLTASAIGPIAAVTITRASTPTLIGDSPAAAWLARGSREG